MGNCDFREPAASPVVFQSRSQFSFLAAIGKGGFGRVWKVQVRRSKRVLALKEMNKGRVLLKHCVASVMNEIKLLARLKHGFLVNIHGAFQDSENLYLVMDYLEGGDLRGYLDVCRGFSEGKSRFFVACVLLALEYLHGKHVVHRDLKPENIVMDARGYLRVTDLGISCEIGGNSACDISGTPGYMAPEAMTQQHHDFTVDYFALGVMTYEFMLGRRPYAGGTRKEVWEAMLARQVQVTPGEIPTDWSLQSADFINKLIQLRPNARLGVGGIQKIMNHPWLVDFPWEKLRNKQLKAPSQPWKNGIFASKTAEIEWKDNEKAASAALTHSQNTDYFQGYFYDLHGRKATSCFPPLRTLKLP